ncbi:MAG: hypothetical protein N2517_07805 [Ignavibacteria bacterium]|nr:hypothetical protein [Ignavibacteria bacterium]
MVEHITSVPDGLDAILTITGFSKESFQRLITFIRVYDDEDLSKLFNKSSWAKEDFQTEWDLNKIKHLLRSNKKFAEGIVNIFFQGATIKVIKDTLPLFEFKKLDINKFTFTPESLIDTIVRYKTKGSYKALRKGNPEVLIENILNSQNLKFEKGKFGISKVGDIPRTMDFIVPNKTSPKLIIECSYSVTTASGMGDKAKTEKTVAEYINKNYPKVVFVGFIDGIGWYVRKADLKRMVEAYDYVFTFHNEELKNFEKLLMEVFNAG